MSYELIDLTAFDIDPLSEEAETRRIVGHFALLREDKILRRALELAISGETICPGMLRSGNCPKGWRFYSQAGNRSQSGELMPDCKACRMIIAIDRATAELEAADGKD